MTDSDSDSDSYESAEDSFECAVEDEVSKINKQEEIVKNDVEATVSRDDSFEISSKAGEKENGNESLMYRKRPERVKRLSSKSPTRITTITKKTSADTVFKSDIISPDVLLQDITSNLSKNINKGLNTLQQQSSNVKSLILNSIPAGSVEKEKGFSYDEDRNVFPADDAPLKASKSEGFISNTSVEVREAVLFKSEGNVDCEGEFRDQNNKKENMIISEVENDKTSVKKESQKENLVQPDKKIEKTLENEKFYASSKIETTAEIFNCEKEKHEENIEKIDCLKINSDFKSEESNLCKNMLKNVSQEINENENSESFGLLRKNDNKNDEIDSQNENTNTNIDNQGFSDILTENKVQEDNTENNLPEVINDVIDCLSDVQTEKLFKNDSDDIFVTKFESDSKCNIEELKSVLHSLVPNIQNNDNNKDVIEIETAEASFNHPEVAQAGGADGWDDFDFSDNDLDEEDSPKEDDKCKNPEVVKAKELKESNPSTPKDSKNNKIKSNANCNKIDSVNFELKQAKITLPEKVKKNAIKSVKKKTQVEEIKTNKEKWDWDDWDDPSSKKAPKEEKTQKINKIVGKKLDLKSLEISEKAESKGDDDFFDDSRWGGWENFGQKQEDKQLNWNLSSWGTNILSKATAVTQGISTVLEAGLGAPDPETLARMEKLEREKMAEQREDSVKEPEKANTKKDSLTDNALFPVFGITSLVAGVTSKIVEHSKIQEIGSKVITGGLDTLETFGKKTMEVLQEGDPGLRSKRALFLGSNKPVLSQVLREAQEKADRELKKVEEKEFARKCHFETLFDDFQGMVHLEALEMLSTQCELKLEQIRSSMNEEEKEDLEGILEEVEQLCSLEDVSIDSSLIDFKISLNMAVEPLKDEISVKQILQVYDNVETWLKASSETASSNAVHQKIVSTLAELTSATVHQFHKVGELLAVKECRKTVEEIDSLSKMTTIVCNAIQKLSEKFSALAQKSGETDLVQKIGTVMDNSRSYIKQAFNLLIPVVQIGAAI